MATNTGYVDFNEAAAPSTPAASKVRIYAKADGLLYSKDDAGTETLVSGGAGGGAVATDAIWDAKGDLAGGTGANTAARLAVGTDGHVLTADAAQATGMKWAAATAAFVGAQVYSTAAQSIATATSTALTFDAESFDTDAFHDTVTNTSRLTIPTGLDGYYRIDAAPEFASNATGTRKVEIRKNGTTTLAAATIPAGNAAVGPCLTTVASLVATDYLEVLAYQTSGGNLNVAATSTRPVTVQRVG